MMEGTRLFPNLCVACVIACATWRCHASALFLDALTLGKIHVPIKEELDALFPIGLADV